MSVQQRFGKKRSHRLFENERHVEARKTSSLLDEAVWKQADTLNDDADHIQSDTAPDGILYRNLPQVEEHSDRNPKPDSQNTQQERMHGEPDENLRDKLMEREVLTEPQQGETYPGRDSLLRNNQPNQQSYYGGDTSDNYIPRNAQKNQFTTEKGQDDWLQKLNPFATPVAFDLFVSQVGEGSSLNQKNIDSMNPKLVQLLLKSGLIQQPTYAVDKQRLQYIINEMKRVNRDLSQVTLKELEEYITGTPKGEAYTNTKPGSGSGQSPQDLNQMLSQQPSPEVQQQQDTAAMLQKAGKIKLRDVRDRIQVSDLAKRYIDLAIAKEPQIDLNAFTSWTPDRFLQAMKNGQLRQVADVVQELQPEVGTEPKLSEQLAPPEQQADQQTELKSEPDIPAIQQEVLKAVYSMADQVLAEYEQQSQQKPLQTTEEADFLRLMDEQGDPLPQHLRPRERNKAPKKKPVGDETLRGDTTIIGRKAMKMTVGDVAKFSPEHARRMQAAGIEWVDGELYQQAYRKQLQDTIKTAASATRTAFEMRKQGKSINEIIGFVSHAVRKGKFSQRDADVACVMMHRLAQLTCMNRENLKFDELMVDTNSFVERFAAKSEVAIPVYIKTAAKQVRSVDYTLYNMDHGGADKDFNYADPWDVNWTLYRGKEGKKGAQVHVCKSPAQAMSLAKQNGDGNYLIVGESILDDAYWGTYTVQVEKGIVINYAKLPLDASGKRFAGKQDNNKLIQARRRFVAIYRALAKRDLFAQSEQFYASPYEQWPQSEEEVDKRYDEAVAEDGARDVVRQKVDEWIKRLDRELKQRYPQQVGEFPTQDEADKKFDELLAANPDVLQQRPGE